MINAIAPAIPIDKSDPGPGVSLFESLAGVFTGGRRRRRRPLNKSGAGGGIFSRPYYLGQVMGSGMKMITYFINHGTTVVRARRPDAGEADGVPGDWLREAVGGDNAEFLRQWLLRQTQSRS